MSKNKGFLEEIVDMYILYKFRYVILIIIFAAIAVLIFVTPKMDKEYQNYGYTGYTDKIKYDQWTGEIIPKQEIETYNNDDKYITNSKGEQITFKQMKDLIKQYEQTHGGSFANIKQEKLEALTSICDILIKDYLELDYEVVPFGRPSDNMYNLKIKGEYEDSYYSNITSSQYLAGFVKEVVRDKYKKQMK